MSRISHSFYFVYHCKDCKKIYYYDMRRCINCNSQQIQREKKEIYIKRNYIHKEKDMLDQRLF